MKTNYTKTVAAVVVTICGVFAANSPGQQSAAKVQIPRTIQYNGDMAHLLSVLPDTYGPTIGLETDPQQPWSQAQVSLENPTLADVLNAMVRSVPRYQWRSNGEFIEILPIAGGTSLLDTNIIKFLVSEADAKDAVNQLLLLPEVQANMSSMKLERKELSTERRGKKFSMSLENVTMREALNRIAKESGTRFWIFRRENNRVFTLNNVP